MKKLALKLLIATYQRLPEWMVRYAVFFVIGFSLGVGFVFLALRPEFRRVRRLLLKRR